MNNHNLVIDACRRVALAAAATDIAVEVLRQLLGTPAAAEAAPPPLVAPEPAAVESLKPPASQRRKLKPELVEPEPGAKPIKGLWGKIVELLRSSPGQEFNAPDVAKKIREDKKAVGIALSGLRKRGNIKKTRFGHYAIADGGASAEGHEDGSSGEVQEALHVARNGAAEEAAFDQGKEAFATRGPKEKADDRNPYLGKAPALAAAFLSGWKKAGGHE